MPSTRRVLITGIARPLATALAARLEEWEDVEALVGIDVREPARHLRRTEVVRMGSDDPDLPRLLDEREIDTAVHLGLVPGPPRAVGRLRRRETNVLGSMHLLAACQEAPALRRFVLASTTAVYGSDPAAPALVTEEALPRSGPGDGPARDALEVERYARSLARRREDVTLTVLRLAPVLGAAGEPVTDLLGLPVVPTFLGFDPRLQFLHEEDAVTVLLRAATSEVPGTVNVAGPGVVYLSQCLARAGRPTLPVPGPLAGGTFAALHRVAGVELTADQVRILRYGQVADITRLVEEVGERPRYSTRQALEEFLRRGGADGTGRVPVGRCRRAGHRLLAGLVPDPGRE